LINTKGLTPAQRRRLISKPFAELVASGELVPGNETRLSPLPGVARQPVYELREIAIAQEGIEEERDDQ
jgi:hypothetical protein